MAGQKDTEQERKLYGEIAIVLFRMDKADPESADDRSWKQAKSEYTKRGRRLWKALGRAELRVVYADSTPEVST